jgi:hypothetical protein
MKKTVKILIFISLFFIVFSILCLYIGHLNNIKYKKIIAHKKMYCYETYHKGVVNPVLFVRDTIFCDSLKQYYQKMEKGNLTPHFNFRIYIVPIDTFVYVLNYSKDSTIAKIAFYYQYKNKRFADEGYVYTHTLHQNRKYNKF